MMSKRKLNRRDFLRGAGLAGVGSALVAAGCQPQTIVVKETVEVEKIVTQVVKETVKETVVVEGTPQVIEKEVEKVVEVTVAPPPQLSGDLRLWVFPLTENDLDWIWAPLGEQFNADYPEIDLEVELLPWGGRREKMLTAFAAGEAPDMAYVNTDTISLFGRNDVLLPLDDIISGEDWADFPEDLAPGISWEGKRIMVPALFIVRGGVANKALLEEIDWDPENPPYTWDDVREAAARAKELGYYYESQNTLSMNRLVDFVWQAGGTMLSEDTTTSLMDQEHGIEAVTFLSDFFKNEWSPLEGAVGSVEEGDAAGSIDYFMIGEMVYRIGNPNVTEQVNRQNPDIELVFVPTYENVDQIFNVGAGCWGIFKNTEFLEGSSAWINFMIEPEHQGFYCSASGFAVPRASAQKYWTADPSVKKHVEINLPSAAMGWDLNYWWQLQKVVGAPHWQAAALGLKTPEEACQDYAAELNVAIAEELAKEE
jgi:multiple sugar transport system substrate-binding protein